jgi:hypothetical protein
MEHKVEYLNNSDKRSTGPILEVSRTFYYKDTSPCEITNFGNQNWYHGTGVPPKEHPGRNLIRPLDYAMLSAKCLYCESKSVLVIALQGCVSHSGDAYYDYEIICSDCNRFSACSYAEN